MEQGQADHLLKVTQQRDVAALLYIRTHEGQVRVQAVF